MEQRSLLSSCRVLDLGDEKGFLCGKILGDLGADVIKVEKPGGDPSRKIGPFYHDVPDPENSLYWFAYNTSKKGITLDIATTEGQRLFKRMVATADFLIETFPPGYMNQLHLDYDVLEQINPRLIMVSITPFGQSGPFKDYKAPDIVAMAMSGLTLATGESDRAPVRIGIPQAYPQAGAQAAMAAAIAFYHRERTGEGQYIDVSMQECALWGATPIQQFSEISPPMWQIMKNVPSRGSRSLRGGIWVRGSWPCKDGWVSWRMMVGPGLGLRIRYLVDWMESEGMAGDMKGIDWEWGVDLLKTSQQEVDHWEELWGSFFMTKTMAELYEGAIERGIALYPVNSFANLLSNPQLEARGFFVQQEHDDIQEIVTYPGAPYKSTELPYKIRSRAPRIGEHNEEVFRNLGLSIEETVSLKERGII